MARRSILALAFPCFVVACASSPPPSPTAPRETPGLRILDDDYARALAEARAKKVPIVAVTGARWCDACREMRARALGDPTLASHNGDFVWLAIDVEHDANAAFVAHFASEAEPALWVIDPSNEMASLVWRGVPSASLLGALAARGAAAIHAPDPSGDAGALARAFRADAAGDSQRAIDEYKAAIDRADNPDRALAVEAMVALLATRGDHAACADLATREIPKLAASDRAASIVALGLDCDGASTPLLENARRIVADAATAILPVDRSTLFAHVVADARRRGDDDGAKRATRAWIAFLDSESRAARSPHARASLDGARVAAHIALGDPEAAIVAVAQSERDLPDDYGPPANLARAFAAAHRWDDARRAIDRAVAVAYGPYRIVLLARKVDIEIGVGDRHSALRTLDGALTLARSLPLNGAYARVRASLEIRRSEWHTR